MEVSKSHDSDPILALYGALAATAVRELNAAHVRCGAFRAILAL